MAQQEVASLIKQSDKVKEEIILNPDEIIKKVDEVTEKSNDKNKVNQLDHQKLLNDSEEQSEIKTKKVGQIGADEYQVDTEAFKNLNLSVSDMKDDIKPASEQSNSLKNNESQENCNEISSNPCSPALPSHVGKSVCEESKEHASSDKMALVQPSNTAIVTQTDFEIAHQPNSKESVREEKAKDKLEQKIGAFR